MRFQNKQAGVLPLISSYFPRQALVSALDDSKVGVVICDRRMRYKALNESVAEIHNVPIEAHIGHFSHEILGSFAEKVVPLWEKVFATGVPLPNLEVTGHLPKRSDVGRWIENLFPLVDGRGRVAQVGCIVIEIPPPSPPASVPATPAVHSTFVKGHPSSDPERSQLPSLSRREREVIQLVSEGKSSKEISAILAVSIRTVETYRARLMLKLRVTSSIQLAHYAIRHRIVTI